MQPMPQLAATDPDARDRAEILALVERETQAFLDRDFDAWAKCWSQDENTQNIFASSTFGVIVESGWDRVARSTADVIAGDVACDLAGFSNCNAQVTIDDNMAWVIYEQNGHYADGRATQTVETRILTRGPDGWRISYLACMIRQNGALSEAGMISLDDKGKVIWAAPETLAALTGHPVFMLSQGRLRSRRPAWDRVLQEAIRKAGKVQGFFDLQRHAESTGAPFGFPVILGEDDVGRTILCQIEVQNGLTNLFTDIESRLERRLAVAATVFSLSDGQSRIARHIAQGCNLKEAARAEGISINTARTHLTRLYEKTGVNSQTALVRLLLSVG